MTMYCYEACTRPEDPKLEKSAIPTEAPAPKTPPVRDVSSYARMKLKMKSMAEMIDAQHDFMERLMQGPIGEQLRIEHVDTINDLEKQCSAASESLVALSPKAAPPVQVSRPWFGIHRHHRPHIALCI